MALAAGCGGGGGSNSGNGNDEPATRLRTFSQGDAWVYDTSITYSAEDQATYTTYGTSRATMSATIVDGQNFLVQSSTVSTPELSFSDRKNLVQDVETRDVLAYEFPLGAPIEGSGYVVVPGMFSSDYAKSSGINGGRYSFIVQGKETVSVPAGHFDTWRVHQTSISEEGQVDGTYWYAPETGNFVKADYVTRFDKGAHAGQSYTYHSELKSTNTRSR